MTKSFVKYLIAFLFISAMISWSFVPDLKTKYRFLKVRKAISAIGYPVQPAFNPVILLPCKLVGCPIACKCVGATLCNGLDQAQCELTEEATGGMAGTVSSALFTKIDLSLAGVKNGGQLMAGMTSVSMPTGNVCLAGEGGCVGTCCIYGTNISWH